MTQNRKITYLVLAVFILSIGIWDHFYKPKKQIENSSAEITQAPPKDSVTLKQSAQKFIEEKIPNKETIVQTIQTHNGSIQLTNEFVFLKNWELSNYTRSKNSVEKVNLNLISHTDHELNFIFDSPEYLYLKDVKGDIQKISEEEYLWSYEDSNILLNKKIKINPGTSDIQITYRGTFKSNKPNYAFLSIKGRNSSDKDPEAQFRSFVYFTEKKFHKNLIKDLKIGAFNENRAQDFNFISTPVKWIGLASRYFLFGVLPSEKNSGSAQLQPLGAADGRLSYVTPLTENNFDLEYKVFFGPKELALLRSFEPTMDTAVDLGWFSFIGYFLLRAMNWLFLFVHNYGFAIIILTVTLKIVTYPLTYKSMKSMKEMTKLQPEINKIREKYKDNKEKLNQEMMALMKNKGYNPLAGCLPMLIQMPVFIALYNVLLTSVELYQAPFGLWIMDLSEKDPYFITPIVLSGLMWFQQVISPSTATDPMQKRMMQLMPLIFGLFMLYLPSGLTIYMLANVISGIIQQVILNKKLGLKNASLPIATAN